MRDPKRIRKVCNKLASAWETTPDLRFGQLVTNVMLEIQKDERIPFYVEDEEMISNIEEYCQNIGYIR